MKKKILIVSLTIALVLQSCIMTGAKQLRDSFELTEELIADGNASLRDPIIPDAPDSPGFGFEIIGLENPSEFPAGQIQNFIVTGAHVLDKDKPYVEGDGVWIPIYWMQFIDDYHVMPWNDIDETRNITKTFNIQDKDLQLDKSEIIKIYIFFRLWKVVDGTWKIQSEKKHVSVEFMNSKVSVTAEPTTTLDTSPTITTESAAEINVSPTITTESTTEINVSPTITAKPAPTIEITPMITTEPTTTITTEAPTTTTTEAPHIVSADETKTVNTGSSSTTITEASSHVTLNAPTYIKAKTGKRQATLIWKKSANITGYEIKYSQKKNMSDPKTISIKKASCQKKIIKKLTSKKTYYFQIRTYKTVKGKKYYSDWSSKKKVKVK